MNTSQKTRPKVIIIGAGLAGLSTAFQLFQLSRGLFDIEILEARNRVGGRVETLRKPFSYKLFAEAGAFWISDKHALTLYYCRKFGLNNIKEILKENQELQYISQDFQFKCPAVVREDGQPLPLGSRTKKPSPWPNLRMDESQVGLYAFLSRYLCSYRALLDAGDPNWPYPQISIDVEKLDKMNFLEFLKNTGASDGAIDLMRPWFAWWDNLEKLSALSILRDGAVTRQLCDEGHPRWYTLSDGMSQLPEAFQHQLKNIVKITFNAPVVKITQNGNAVTVTHGNAEKQLSGDYLVCAIPFSTLRYIENLPFSPNKLQTIHQLRYSTVARVYLQCRKRVWKKGKFNGVVFTDIRKNSQEGIGSCGMNLLDMTLAQNSENGILQAYMVGDLGREVTAMKEVDRIRFFANKIKPFYPGIEKEVDWGHCTSKCWDNDEWARGAYHMFEPGQMMTLIPHITNTEGHVFFAGDHTSGRPGWMEGALQSGHRVAKEILKMHFQKAN
ncbi:MAG: FAD-dependent oxidoreductase [Nitrospirales bacterium]|nr:FAD-dependent oxidoreductase [Nitrospirales bacterium]